MRGSMCVSLFQVQASFVAVQPEAACVLIYVSACVFYIFLIPPPGQFEPLGLAGTCIECRIFTFVRLCLLHGAQARTCLVLGLVLMQVLQQSLLGTLGFSRAVLA